MKPSDEFRPFGTVPTQLEPLRPDNPEFSTLFGDLSKDDLSLLHEFKSRESEVTSWIAGDPRRASLLETDPQAALHDLLLHLKLDDRELKGRVVALPRGWSIKILQLRKVAVGTQLMQAVWAHLNAAEQNLISFKADPFAVVAGVAASSGATAEEQKAVVEALSTVLGIAAPKPGSMLEWIRNKALVDGWNQKMGAVFLHRE